MVSSLNQAYYHRNFYAAGRVAGTEGLPTDATATETAELLSAAADARPE
jgi:hypothetical protein